MIKKNKKLFYFLLIIGALGLIRLSLPSVIKLSLNNYLQDFSPSISAHINDVDLGIVRSAFTFKGISAQIKKKDEQFLLVNSLKVNLSWKEIFQGIISSNILIDKAHLKYSESLLPALEEHLKTIEDSPKEEEARFRIGRVDLLDSRISTDLFPTLTTDEQIVLSEINARISNLIPSKKSLLSPFNLSATLLGSGEVKVEGEANLFEDKPKWSLDSEVLKFDMTSLNKFLKDNLPLTFTKGELDLYSEAKSEGGAIEGYIKPFVKGLDVIKSEEEFEGARHWIIEIISALGNITLSSDEVSASRIPFRYDTEFRIDGTESIKETLSHGFTQEQTRGIENSIELKQAQEEE